MSYTDFSTENADYRLLLSCHWVRNKEPLNDLDAIILECTDSFLKGVSNKSIRYLYSGILKTAEENKISLYNIDVYPKLFLDMFEVTCILPLYVPSLVAEAISAFSKEKTIPYFTGGIGIINWILQSGLTELRNAVCARKTDEFIAPKLKEKLGRKPKIGIVYGAGHAGIKLDLKYKKMRDFTIWNHKKLNFKEYFGLTKKGRADLSKIEEADYENGKWVVKKQYLKGMF